MAFHQPTRQVQQRLVRVDTAEHAAPSVERRASTTQEASQTWVLFSPITDTGIATSNLSSDHEDQPTPGRSLVRELGSIGTSGRLETDPSDLVAEESADDAELDSLDSHLPEFRTISSPYGPPHTAPVFPGHDGLGSFRSNGPGFGGDAQDQLFAFERYNPRRVKRRRESLEVAQLVLDGEGDEVLERNRRVEAWRLEQSRLLLQEVQNETRRRRKSEATAKQTTAAKRFTEDGLLSADAAGDIVFTENDWHDQDAPVVFTARRGPWSRLTRKFIHDILGIDDKTMAILFGGALPDHDEGPQAAPTNASAALPMESESLYDSTWQLHMLERIARELGLFIHGMSTPHPGAFSTHKRVQQMPLPYAGLPVIPEGLVDAGSDITAERSEEAHMPQFRPTVDVQASSMGARRPSETAPQEPGWLADVTPTPQTTTTTFTQQEWEQALDIKLVFRYLRSRFTSSRAAVAGTAGTAHAASTQDAAAKAARVRLHHPLAGRRPTERRAIMRAVTAPSNSAAIGHGHARSASHAGTRRSATRRSSLSVSSRPSSSRHYWAVGGSIGTGSMIASTGPMGSWGEV